MREEYSGSSVQDQLHSKKNMANFRGFFAHTINMCAYIYILGHKKKKNADPIQDVKLLCEIVSHHLL